MAFPLFIPIMITLTTAIAQHIIKKSFEGESGEKESESEVAERSRDNGQ